MDTIPHADLATSCRDARSPDRNLEGEIFRTLEAREGDNWSDNFGDDDVWHREDPVGDGGWDAPPHYMTSIDAVDQARGKDLRLVSLREHETSDIGNADPAWRPCGATVSDGLRIHEGRGYTLATAYMDAVLTARGAR